MVTKFKNHLARTNLARNTINSYVWTIEYFLNHYGEVNKRNLLAYKGYLVENFKPQTVNLRTYSGAYPFTFRQLIRV